MTDATLTLKVDYSEADRAATSLDKLAQAGTRAEGGAKKAGNAATEMAASYRQAASPVAQLEARIDNLMASVDPLYTAQRRLDGELREAASLYKLGALGASDYARAVRVLEERQAGLFRSQSFVNTGNIRAADSSKVLQQATLNLGRQFADVGVTLSSGMSPLMVLIQQGPQIADGFAVASASGLGFKAVMAGVYTTIAPFIPVLAGIALAAGVIAAPFAISAQKINNDNEGVLSNLGLTKEQLKSVGGEAVTMGDVAVGAFQATAKGLTAAFGPEIEAVETFFGDMFTAVIDFGAMAVRNIAGGFIGALLVIKDTWRLLPAAVGDITISAANAVLRGVFGMVNGAIDIINGLVSKANGVAEAVGLAFRIPELNDAQVVQITNAYEGAALRLGQASGERFAEGFAIADRIGASIGRETLEARERRLRRGATPARGGGAEGGAAAAEVEAAKQYVEVMNRVAAINLQPLTTQQDLQLAILTAQADQLRLIDGLARSAGQGLAESFGSAGAALAGITTALSGYRSQLAEINLAERENRLTGRQAARERASVEVQSYGNMASAAKGFFGERTAAFKALQGVEMAYRALQFANAVKAMALDTTETGSSIANSLARGAAKAAEAVADIFAKLGPFGFPVAAAALAVMASVGVRALGGGGGGAAPALPTTNTGTGTVLGDPTAESASIGNSIERAERYWNRDLDYSNKMVGSLKAIETNIAGVTTAIARQMGVGGGLNASGLNLGTSTSGGFLGIGATTRNSTLADQGINLSGGSLAQVIAQGVTGSLYQIVQTTSTNNGFLGIGASTRTRNNETTSGLGGGLSTELTRLLSSLRDGVLTAASEIGVTGAEAVLDAFQVDIGRISFEGLSNSEISETLSAVFSAVGDDMAAAILPGLSAFQKAGEGMFETLTRLATEYRAVDQTLASIGMAFGSVGLASVEARSRLIDLSGGLDAFIENADFFAQNFLSDAQRIAPVQAAVTAELARLGVAADISRTGFADLVLGLDVSTAAGAQMFASLMNLAPALDQVIRYNEELTGVVNEVADAIDLTRQRRALEISLMDAQGNAAGALAARRQDELNALDASLQPLQLAIYAALDLASANAALATAQQEAARISEAAAQEAQRAAELRASYAAQAEADAMKLVESARSALTASYEREADALRGTIDRFRGFSDSLRQFRLGLGSEGSSQGASFAVSKADFERTSALARLGNEEALGELQGVSEAYLEQSRTYSRSSLDYLRDLGAVKASLQAAEEVAGRQASVAEQQLTALTDSVSGLITLNASVLSVRDAIGALAGAQAVLASASPTDPNPGREYGLNPEVNRLLARQTGFTGDFGSGGFQAFIETQDESVKAVARATLAAQGQAYRIGFATGGSFEVGGNGGTDSTPISFMATPGEMVNIRRPGDSDSGEMASLRAELAEHRRLLTQMVLNTGETARATRNTADDLDRVVNGGEAINTVAA